MRQILLLLSLWTLFVYGDIHQAVDIDGNTIYTNDEGMVTDANGNIIYLDDESVAIDETDEKDEKEVSSSDNEISYDNVIYDESAYNYNSVDGDEAHKNPKMFSNQKMFAHNENEMKKIDKNSSYTVNTPYKNTSSELNHSTDKLKEESSKKKVEEDMSEKIESTYQPKEAVAIKKIKEWVEELKVYTDKFEKMDKVDILPIVVAIFVLFFLLSWIRSKFFSKPLSPLDRGRSVL